VLRLFVSSAAIAGRRVRISGAELRHLRTLRLGTGDGLVVFDECGREHHVILAQVGTQEAKAEIVDTREPRRESPLDLVLAPALLKGTKMDLVIEKATELGVRRVAPAITRYTIGQRGHVERWRRIALAAAKQSGRTVIPVVDEPAPLAELLASTWPGLRLLAWEDEHATTLAALPTAASAVVVLIGPEGGFHADEVSAARAAGFATVKIAGRVLRAETASIAAVALCQHRWGDG
jgi:16S rRNA (uracil1498-N3)-methyltransferase